MSKIIDVLESPDKVFPAGTYFCFSRSNPKCNEPVKLFVPGKLTPCPKCGSRFLVRI